MKIDFKKYQGTGNDFVIMDNRTAGIQLNTQQINHLCDRRFGVGADGLILLQNLDGFDFEMVYYNADGKESSMCGNGGRCITQFYYDLGHHQLEYRFKAIDGPHEASIEKQIVRLKMKDVHKVHESHHDYMLDTGSPHLIKFVDNLLSFPVKTEGANIRYSKQFEAVGINVNFVETVDDDTISVRTYERGVEDETFSCGTGVTAAALVSAHNDLGFNRIEVRTLGGHLAVEFDKMGETRFENIWLCGPAKFVFDGVIEI